VHGRLAVKHVVMESERGREPATHIVMLSRPVIYRILDPAIRVTVLARHSPPRLMLPAEFTAHQQLEIPGLDFVKSTDLSKKFVKYEMIKTYNVS